MGDSGFTPSTVEQILGRFNDAIRGRAFLFLDEVVFSGDRRAADAVKRLSTATEIGIETKGLPVVQCPVAVNLWLASNRENAAHIEEHDARYWVHEVSEHRIGDSVYFGALGKEIETGGREAFAHFLLNRDVENFVPWRDIKKDTEAKRSMVKQSINPFDARKWLKDCCVTESLIGHKGPFNGWTPWVAGEKYPSAVLAAAYVEWQKTVKTAVAPQPTQSHRLGGVLSECGFGQDRAGGGSRERVLPNCDTCLNLLGEETHITHLNG
jgi:hypothetical protein